MSTLTTTVNYQSDKVPASLVSTGTVYMTRDETGSDTPPVGLDTVCTEVNITNGRLEDNYTLHNNGFELVDHHYNHIDYFDENQIVKVYYKEIERFIQEKLGADKVVAYDHNIRSVVRDANSAIRGGNLVQGPALIVHNDFSATSAERRLHQLAELPRVNDTWGKITNGQPLLSPEDVQRVTKKSEDKDQSKEETKKEGRYVFVNFWRNITDHPVQNHHLAMVNGTTLQMNELITFEIRYADRIGENYFSQVESKHEWVYFPHLTKEEGLLLKVWDSVGWEHALQHHHNTTNSATTHTTSSTPSPVPFSLHTAVTDPTAPENAPPRSSMEVRLLALFYP